MSEKIKIASLELENVKRVRAVALEPSENGLTVIGGRNGQGKTSVLDGIAYALGGEKFRPSSLQNTDGMAPARMEVVLSNGLKVTRSGKNAALKVLDPTGARSGQKLLDSLIEEFALNLPKFMVMSDQQKAKVLLHTLGIEEQLEQLDNDERKAYEERKLQNADADRKAKYAAELPEFPEAPDEPLSAADMSARLTEALRVNAAHAEARKHLEWTMMQVTILHDKIAGIQSRIAELTKELEQAKDEHDKMQKHLEGEQATPIEADVDTSAIQAELEQIDSINAKVRTNMEKSKAMDIAAEAKELAKILDGKVNEVRERRMALLSSVQMPLEGLSVEDGALVYKGQKWDCMSSMEQFRVAVAVCHQLKPECGFVLLDRLEAFDLQQLADFNEWLKSQGMQAIATRVSEGDECSIVIEDGMVSAEAEEHHAEEELADQLKDDNDIGGF